MLLPAQMVWRAARPVCNRWAMNDMTCRAALVSKMVACVLAGLSLASCTNPSARFEARSAGKKSVAFDFKMRGCWGINVGCFGASELTVTEVATYRKMWKVEFPGLMAGAVEYGRVPRADEVKRSRYSNEGEWPGKCNVGYHKAAPLPMSTPLLARLKISYDSPFPSGSEEWLFFRIEPDGRITVLDEKTSREAMFKHKPKGALLD